MNIVVDGYNICYKTTGTGDKTVVILQGWGTDLGVYDSVAGVIDGSRYRGGLYPVGGKERVFCQPSGSEERLRPSLCILCDPFPGGRISGGSDGQQYSI